MIIGIDNPEHFSKSGTYNEGERAVFQDSSTAPGTYTVSFESHDEYSSSVTVSRTITVQPSPFEEIIPNVTHVKASHIIAIRTAVNTVRNYYGMTAFSWSKGIVVGVTEVRDWVFHVIEIRLALNPIIDLINNYNCESSTFDVDAFAWIPLTNGRPKADVMNQIHALILCL